MSAQAWPGAIVGRVHAFDLVVRRRHPDPHSVLGPHAEDGGVVIRVFRPEADSVTALLEGGASVELGRVHPSGVFAGLVADSLPVRYELEVDYPDGNTFVLHDPYAFEPTIDEDSGCPLGAHVLELDGVTGTSFAVWAPGASAVSVVGDFNSWDGRMHPMRSLGDSGVWELFVPDSRPGQRYKFELLTRSGALRMKADPCAFEAEPNPGTSSVIHRSTHRWGDEGWMRSRHALPAQRAPISIYEVHLGSWLRDDAGGPLSYTQLADALGAYACEMGFTHVELLPVMAHPFAGSWGYQVTSYFAPTPRFGSPDELREMVDRLHQRGVGVILDWVPAHFPKDDWALRLFDETELYEHVDPGRSEHPDWGTLVFDFGRPEVRAFLLASALHWLREYHADGLRVDAVTSMLHLDFSRGDGQWSPNELGGREDLDAVAFVRELNEAIRAAGSEVLCIAEEATSWPGVTRPLSEDGLGFDLKWNLGWMHDTLAGFSAAPDRLGHQRATLMHTLSFAFDERFVLPLGHDEVVYGKGSLLTKMPGPKAHKLALLRSLYGYTWAYPGKKLLFMGQELAQVREWHHDRTVDWHLLDDPAHAGVQALVRDLNHVYRTEPALWQRDSDPDGFAWIEPEDGDPSLIAFARHGEDESVVVCVCNLTPDPCEGHRLGLPRSGRWREVLNTDAEAYGGANVGNLGGVEAEGLPWHSQPFSAVVTLPPLSVLWLAPDSPGRGQ